jgi:hypothetical protein
MNDTLNLLNTNFINDAIKGIIHKSTPLNPKNGKVVNSIIHKSTPLNPKNGKVVNSYKKDGELTYLINEKKENLPT